MADLTSKKLIVAKGLLFLGLIVAAAVLIFLERPTWQTVALLVVLVWASARFYYFLFYVLEKYVDPSLRYAGVGALVGAIVRRRRRLRFGSADELFAATRGLIGEMRQSGHSGAASELESGMACLNGLTDGWALFLKAIDRVRADGTVAWTEAQADVLGAIRSDVHRHVSRR